jgi:hypothetical protein
VNVAFRKQQGGTCWFHAIMNGLLMSYMPRKYLREMIKQKGISNNSFTMNSCPRTIDGFWKYIAYRLKGAGNINARVRNVNVIKAVGARRKFANPLGFIPRRGNTVSSYTKRVAKSRSSVTGGSISDLYNIYTKLFANDFSYRKNSSTPKFFLRKGNDFEPYFKYNGEWYYISHAYIQVSGRGGFWGHAIAGYKTMRGTYKISDSNLEAPYDFNWRVSENDKILIDWMNEVYGLPSIVGLKTIKKYAIYVRQDS